MNLRNKYGLGIIIEDFIRQINREAEERKKKTVIIKTSLSDVQPDWLIQLHKESLKKEAAEKIKKAKNSESKE